RMYVPGEKPANSPVPLEYIITHEFGHHISNHRKNALGSAFIAGPEYWATSQFICAGALLTRPPVFFPGDEDQHYLDNPGEGWAARPPARSSSPSPMPDEERAAALSQTGIARACDPA